ncbi:MAG TPA: glycosyltransferase [Candidatus Binatia bacterium]|nr:glycosyltransferase [Candidatus Binatia bacterium]
MITMHDEEPRFLHDALESVFAQTAPAREIIVVDDGSRIDNAEVLRAFPTVRVIRQANQGLAATRNAGWRAATSRYVVFLDSDDRLAPHALACNLRRFAAHADCALVYGAFRYIDREGRRLRDGPFTPIGDDPYETMLLGNAIGMHATVMYRRECLDAIGGFDSAHPACEDYELYLRLARRFRFASGHEVIAEYRQHARNMSSDSPLMLGAALAVLREQEPFLGDDPQRRSALDRGLRRWKSFYAGQQLVKMYDAAKDGRWGDISIGSFLRVSLAAPLAMAGAILRGLYSFFPRRHVDLDSLRRTAPISRHFGYDRGKPVDRRYIETFLRRHAGDIRGRVLEVGSDAYTRGFGGERVTQRDVLHVNPAARNATLLGDLQDGGHLESDAFDCIVLTQTLHLLFDIPAAVATLHRILKPGGVLLVTVPGVSSVDSGEWGGTWMWSLTAASLGRLLARSFAENDVAVTTYGNVLTAVAFLHGLAEDELRPGDYDVTDPHYPVIVAGRAKKAEHGGLGG